MPVKYIFLAVLVLFDRELIASGETETKNVTSNTAHVNETKVTLIPENDPIVDKSDEGRALVNKKAKTYNNNKRKQQFNVQIIAEPDPNQSYLDRYKKKNYLPSNIITKANFTKNKYGEIDDYDYQAILNDPTFDKERPAKKKRKKLTQASTVPNIIDIYYQVSTTTPAPTTFIESTPEKIGNVDITPSLLTHMLNIHQSTTNVKKDRDYYKYMLESEYPRPFVTEQTVFVPSTTVRPVSSRPTQANVLFFSTTTTTTSPADIPSPISAHFSNYGVTIPPRPTLQSTTVEDSIKRPTYSTPPVATTTPLIDLNAYMLRLLKNDTNKEMFRDLLNLNCTTEKKEKPTKAPPKVKKKKKKIVFVKKPQKQADHEEDDDDEEKGIEVVTEVNDVTPPNTPKDNYILLKPIIDELIANQSSDRKKGVAYFEIKSEEVEESDESEYILEKIPEVKDKDSKKKHTKKKKKQKKKKKKKKEHHHDHHHHKKKKKKKHGHHDYDYKKKVKKGNKKKVIKKKGCHSKEEHNYHYYIYKKGDEKEDEKESDEHEYHDKSESYEKHKHHKKKKHHHHHHHHKKHDKEEDSYEHGSYEYRTIAKRDVNASSNITKRNANDTNKVLRTKIHVTSEFANPDVQSTTAPSLDFNDTKSRKPYDDEKSSQETSSYEDDYPTFDMGFDDDYDSRDVSKTREEEEDSEYYSDEYPRKKMKPENSKRPYSYEESQPTKKKKYSKYDDDDYDEPEGFFDMVFGSISRFFSSFMPMPMSKKSKRKNYDSYEDYSDEDGTARSTTPRLEYRRPKKPSLKMEQRRPKDPWYYPSYLFSSSENNEIVVLPTSSPLMGVTTTEKSSWISNLNPLKIFSIFTSQDENQISSPSTVSPTESSDEGMFDWMPNFLSASTTNPPPPVITNQPDSIQINLPKPLQDPATWIGILQALQNATISTTTEPSYNFLPPPKTNQPVVKSYANHQVWRVLPRTQDHVNSLSDHKQGEYGEKLTWLKGPSLRGPTDVIVDPGNLETFKEFLDDEGIPFDITVWDLEKAINYENPQLRYNMMSAEHPLTWYHYHRYSDILKFLEYLQRNFPRNVELIPIGSSYEGMPLVVVKVFANDDHFQVAEQRKNDKKSHTTYKKQSKMRKRKAKPAVFVEAGAHGREWIGPASATWIINHLLDLIHKNNSLNETISAVDWYIMPVLNPDGYEYSHLYDRMWRKTRTKVEKKDSLLTAAMNWLQTDDDDPAQIAALKKYCYGTDLNRNWDNSWGVVGTSQDPCSDYYAGASPFSEPESKALSKFLMEHKKRIKIYVSLHAYGQLIAYPPSPSYAYVNERYDDLFDMAMVSLEKLRNSGSPTKYLIDTSSDMIYHRSGSSDSYAMHQIGIPYAFTVELRGTNGPILPANQIEMAAAEAFYLIQGMVEYI